jgi:hypothetical protein
MPEYLVASFARSAVRLALGAQIEILASAQNDLPGPQGPDPIALPAAPRRRARGRA